MENTRNGASEWLCGSNESRGVAILLSKPFAYDINFDFSDSNRRLLNCEMKTPHNHSLAPFLVFSIHFFTD
jgi:hypothetical protein